MVPIEIIRLVPGRHEYICWDCKKYADFHILFEGGFLQLCDDHFRENESKAISEEYRRMDAERQDMKKLRLNVK